MEDILNFAKLGLVVGLIMIGLFGLVYHFDKASCYDKARNYSTEVKAYSYTKKYCFVTMDGKSVNLDNYYDNVQIK